MTSPIIVERTFDEMMAARLVSVPTTEAEEKEFDAAMNGIRMSRRIVSALADLVLPAFNFIPCPRQSELWTQTYLLWLQMQIMAGQLAEIVKRMEHPLAKPEPYNRDNISIPDVIRRNGPRGRLPSDALMNPLLSPHGNTSLFQWASKITVISEEEHNRVWHEYRCNQRGTWESRSAAVEQERRAGRLSAGEQSVLRMGLEVPYAQIQRVRITDIAQTDGGMTTEQRRQVVAVLKSLTL